VVFSAAVLLSTRAPRSRLLMAEADVEVKM
jgi:hypothetical protein